MLQHTTGTTPEPASPGSETHHGHTVTAVIALVMAVVMATVGIASANASEPTASVSANVDTPAAIGTVGMPTEMKIRALDSTANEKVRQVRQNKTAEKKHEVRIIRTKIVKTAKAQIGDPYRAGHSGPNAFDCSGLVRYVYKQVTGKTLPHYSKAQYKHVTKVSKKNAQPGDLVFFFKNGAHHVGIYIGNNKMIDAPSAGKKVRISPITGSWWGRTYTGIGRILPA